MLRQPSAPGQTGGVLLIRLEPSVELLLGDPRGGHVTHAVDERRAAKEGLDGDPAPLEDGHGYFDAESEAPTTAWPAASRAVSTRYGEQLT